jgi:hypothetical protein
MPCKTVSGQKLSPTMPLFEGPQKAAMIGVLCGSECRDWGFYGTATIHTWVFEVLQKGL